MYFYKTVYRYIGFLVLIIGVCLIPFLPHLINDYDRLETLHINAIVIFLLYLLQSVSSYFFFAYKSAIIKANQKGYIITIVNYATTVVSSIIQVVALYLLKNFTIYILILLGQTILNNLVTAHVADRMYPYIKRKPESKLSKERLASRCRIERSSSALLPERGSR